MEQRRTGNMLPLKNPYQVEMEYIDYENKKHEVAFEVIESSMMDAINSARRHFYMHHTQQFLKVSKFHVTLKEDEQHA